MDTLERIQTDFITAATEFVPRFVGALVVMLVVAYFWQERKRKRTGGKGVQDVVKGYMPGK